MHLSLRVITRYEAIPDCTERTCRCECRMKPLIAAEATTFVLIQKVAKNQVIRNASLPHGLLPCKSGKTWAAAFLRRYRSLMPLASVKSRYALPLRTRPPSFCLISSEAVLLTGKRKKTPPCHCDSLASGAVPSSHASPCLLSSCSQDV
jgi:hypothetical protein